MFIECVCTKEISFVVMDALYEIYQRAPNPVKDNGILIIEMFILSLSAIFVFTAYAHVCNWFEILNVVHDYAMSQCYVKTIYRITIE